METKDKIITCPKSGGDLAYETELAPNIKNYMSISCGYWSNSLLTEGSDFYKEQMEKLPEIYKDLIWKDEKTGLIWIPTYTNVEGKGTIFAFGTDKNNWKWIAVKSVKVKDNEKQKFPIPGKKGKFYSFRTDMTTRKEFNEIDFINALEYLDLLQ